MPLGCDIIFDWLSWLGRGEYFRGLDLLHLHYDSYYPLAKKPVWLSGHYQVCPLQLYDEDSDSGPSDPHDPYWGQDYLYYYMAPWAPTLPQVKVLQVPGIKVNIWVFLFPAWLWWLGASASPLSFSAPVFLFALWVPFCDAISCHPPQATLSFSMKLTPFHHCILNCFAKCDVLWTFLQNMVT